MQNNNIWQPQNDGFTPGQSVAPASTVELSIRGKDLADLDLFSKSDPFCVVFVYDSKTRDWIILDRTEIIDNNLHPEWEKKFVMQYKFEERQLLKFEVYDSDDNSTNLDNHDFIGSLQCSLGEIVAAAGKGYTKPLIGAGRSASNKKQTLTIIAEEVIANKEVMSLVVGAKGLDAKDFFGFGKSDPFLTFSRAGEYNSYTVVHRSEVHKRNLNPDFKPITLSVTTLCNADHQRPIKISVDDWNMNGSHNHIGEINTTVAELVEFGVSASQKTPHVIPFINIKKKQKKGNKYKNSGFLYIYSCKLEIQPSFLDFISNGTELSFTVAVDFTASNGNPRDRRSLHYIDPTGAPNQYMTAIKAVGEIIQDYDTDKMFPALGFGARLPPDGKVSHEFFLNMTNDPYCAGVDGIMAAYNNSLHNVQLYGPTIFSSVIRHVTRFARAYQNDPSNYFVLLIITDGIITDLDPTKSAIIDASDLPLSIIIVGVGSEDFSAMDELDSDDSLLSHGGRTAKRDIVQFVEMQKFISNTGYHNQVTWNKELLAREVLAEIPEQLVGYMKSKKFQPPGGSGSSRPGPSSTSTFGATSPPPAYSP